MSQLNIPKTTQTSMAPGMGRIDSATLDSDTRLQNQLIQTPTTAKLYQQPPTPSQE